MSINIIQGSGAKKYNCSASSVYDSPYQAFNAWDGVVSPAWPMVEWVSDFLGTKTEGTCWIQIALTETRYITGIRYAMSGSVYQTGTPPKRVNVKGSDTGSFTGEEVTLASDAQFEGVSPGTWTNWLTFTRQAVNYVRMEILEGQYEPEQEWDYIPISISEIELQEIKSDVSTDPASDILVQSVTLNGTLGGTGGEDSVYVYFQWGSDTSYGSTTTQQFMGSAGSFSDSISGLIGGQTYHFRAVVTGGLVPVYGIDQTFTMYYGVSGTVEEEGVFVERTVRLYKRSTGELVDETISDYEDGSFLFLTSDQAEHYVVALDDISDATDYDALIYDRVIPFKDNV